MPNIPLPCLTCHGLDDTTGVCSKSIDCWNKCLKGEPPLRYVYLVDAKETPKWNPICCSTHPHGQDVGIHDTGHRQRQNKEIIEGKQYIDYWLLLEAIVKFTPKDSDLPKWVYENEYPELLLPSGSNFARPASE